jgi:broad specificity phosphatase PhoE
MVEYNFPLGPESPSRILLIRHGPSSHRAGFAPVPTDGMHRWRDAYDRAGIEADAAPPRSLTEAVARCDLIVSSDLPRALESAERLAAGRTIRPSSLLRESLLPIPSLSLRLPVRAWDTLATIHWGYRILRRVEASPAELQRVTDAGAWLFELTSDASGIAVVTHGVFRRLVSKHFQAMGWRLSKPRSSYDHWSAWTLERPLGNGAT